MKVDFVKVNPAGNVTIFVTSFVPVELQPAVAKELMSSDHVGGEQVGFVSGRRLRMAGGEFCGNATRSLAALWAFEEGTTGPAQYTVDVSGVTSPIQVTVQAEGMPGVFRADVLMLQPLGQDEVSLEGYAAFRVDFGGIVHYVVEGATDEKVISAARTQMGYGRWDAFGVMFLQGDRLDPYVEVNGVSGMWENSCASGSSAVACLLQSRTPKGRASLRQPGGTLSVSWDGRGVLLSGPVAIVARGEAFLSELSWEEAG